MDQLAGARRGAGGEVTRLDQRHRQTARRGVERAARPRRPAADDERRRTSPRASGRARRRAARGPRRAKFRVGEAVGMTPWTVPGRGGAQTEGEAGVGTNGKPQGWRQRVPGELVSEALGTAIIILFGCGSVAMTVAALNQSDRGKLPFAASGDWLLITTGWGVGVALAVWVAGGVSGAHLNPAVTLAHALRRGFPWSKVPTYWAAQVFGAFVGAAIIYLNYHDAISSVDARNKVTRGTPTRSRRSRSSPPSPRPTSRRGGAAHRPDHRHRAAGPGHLRGDRRVQHARQGQPRAARGRPRSSSASASPSAPTRAMRSTPPATSAPGSWPGSRAGSPSRYRATTARSTSTCGSRSWAR